MRLRPSRSGQRPRKAVTMALSRHPLTVAAIAVATGLAAAAGLIAGAPAGAPAPAAAAAALSAAAVATDGATAVAVAAALRLASGACADGASQFATTWPVPHAGPAPGTMTLRSAVAPPHEADDGGGGGDDDDDDGGCEELWVAPADRVVEALGVAPAPPDADPAVAAVAAAVGAAPPAAAATLRALSVPAAAALLAIVHPAGGACRGTTYAAGVVYLLRPATRAVSALAVEEPTLVRATTGAASRPTATLRATASPRATAKPRTMATPRPTVVVEEVSAAATTSATPRPTASPRLTTSPRPTASSQTASPRGRSALVAAQPSATAATSASARRPSAAVAGAPPGAGRAIPLPPRSAADARARSRSPSAAERRARAVLLDSPKFFMGIAPTVCLPAVAVVTPHPSVAARPPKLKLISNDHDSRPTKAVEGVDETESDAHRRAKAAAAAAAAAAKRLRPSPTPSPTPSQKPFPSPSAVRTATPTPSPTPTHSSGARAPGSPTPTAAPRDLVSGARGNCFPATAAVVSRSRGVVPMAVVTTGEELLVTAGGGGRLPTFARVVAWSHRDAAAVAGVVTLSTAAGVGVTLTPGHLVPVVRAGAPGGAPTLIPAGAVAVGDVVGVAPGGGNATTSLVTAVTASTSSGLYAPHTAAGTTLVVDGVVVSEWTTAVPPWLAAPLLAGVAAVGAGEPVSRVLCEGRAAAGAAAAWAATWLPLVGAGGRGG